VSYRFTVEARQGRLFVSATPEVPDGIWEVTGNADGPGATIAVEQRTPHGQIVMSAHHHTPRE
jgi:hypothetical protein